MSAPTPTPTLADELSDLLNRYSVENESNSPDFLLANYLLGQLSVLAGFVRAREKWYGRDPDGPTKPAPDPVPAPVPPPVRPTPPGPVQWARAVAGLHDALMPEHVAVGFPGTQVTREFMPGVLSTPLSLVNRVDRLLRPSWNADLTPVWSIKLDRNQVMNAQWDRHVRELADWLDGQPYSELILWHEPENDQIMRGGAFVAYFNHLAGLIRERTDSVPLVFASMAYQWLPNRAGTGSVKGFTDNPGHWQGVRADRFATDVYSGSSVPLEVGLRDHPGIARWLEHVVPSERGWSVTERGWLRPAGVSMAPVDHQARAAAMLAEARWLSGTVPGSRVEQVILWNTPGTEGNPNLVLDQTYGEPAAREYIGALARIAARR